MKFLTTTNHTTYLVSPFPYDTSSALHRRLASDLRRSTTFILNQSGFCEDWGSLATESLTNHDHLQATRVCHICTFSVASGVLDECVRFDSKPTKRSPVFEKLMVSQLTMKFCRILWNPKIHCRIHDISPVFFFLSQTNSIHALQSYLFETHFNIIHSHW
jgi:hypothetical protein